MPKSISLSQYVKKRNGVPLGAPGSLQAMLRRSFGAGSFYEFWQYWNPIWGFYLARDVMKPLSRVFPIWLAVLLTFAVSGALHDAAVSAIRWQATFFFTPWFAFMGVIVLCSKFVDKSFKDQRWFIRMSVNLLCILSSYYLTTLIVSLYN